MRGCRAIGKQDLVLNDALPNIEVDPETYEVRADGELLTCEPATCCRWRSATFCFERPVFVRVAEEPHPKSFTREAIGAPRAR